MQYSSRSIRRTAKLSRRMKRAEGKRELRAAQWTFGNSKSVRLVALQKAEKTGRLPQEISSQQMQLIASGIDLLRPSAEPIRHAFIPKAAVEKGASAYLVL